ncbi:Retrotransposon gag protein [Gossypium australe]|uniref:Retrotransposon gag protein n=1 Tax=Gossypium australe TaxID=47621 RepID=A0A5B6UTS5_9ROSI|nr:Retrotransposon gag protein [Gossypium australe]
MMIQVLEDMLQSYVLYFTGSWERYQPFEEFTYKNSYQASIQLEPFEVLYERKCRTPLCWEELDEKRMFRLELVCKTLSTKWVNTRAPNDEKNGKQAQNGVIGPYHEIHTAWAQDHTTVPHSTGLNTAWPQLTRACAMGVEFVAMQGKGKGKWKR